MRILVLFGFLLFVVSCKNDDNGIIEPTDNFDRQAMLANWADNIIIPAFAEFSTKTVALKSASEAFGNAPSLGNYEDLKTAWTNAYLAFQEVSMFEIGMAEELRFTNNLNIYPVDVNAVEENILNGGYNLELPATIDQQGFPALDYLLFGIAVDENAILDFYQNDINASKYLSYLIDLCTRIDSLTSSILDDWNSSFRNDFVNNSGNSANASVDKLVNDYIFYYERHLRAGKIGIPAGVFSGSSLPDKIEAFYKKDFSKALFLRSLNAVQNFFNGQHFQTSTTGSGMHSYLDYLGLTKNGENLSLIINDQFEAARTSANELEENFAFQVETDNVKMLATYDQLQINVVHLKVDMLQAFNINVDYVDADGD